MWIGDRRGALSDWLTQRWVQATGRLVALDEFPWLEAPTGGLGGIAPTFVEDLARAQHLTVLSKPDAGLIPDFAVLDGPDFDFRSADPRVVDFYRYTARYELDSWAEWSQLFRPFGALLAAIFSRRLQQLNVPLGGLDTSRGVTSQVFELAEDGVGARRFTVWLRRLVHTGNVLYAGCYSVATLPGHSGACIRVAFPLPNGNAIVLMRPTLRADGSVVIESSGRRFGDPGFYFTVRADAHRVWVRYVRSLRESIHVYAAEERTVRADHSLTLWGLPVLQLHYRLREANVHGAREAAV